MQIVLTVTPEEAARARAFLDSLARTPFVIRRRERNVDGVHEPINRDVFWEALMSALLTTQQRSGPQSAVNRLIRRQPFPLSLTKCRAATDTGGFVQGQISSFGGIRRGRSIGRQAAQNLAWLEDQGWSVVLPELSGLGGFPGASRERRVAEVLAHDQADFRLVVSDSEAIVALGTASL
jgi:hypothetical protein